MDHAILTASPATSELARKIRRKFLIRRIVGELYVGKRMKMRHTSKILPSVRIPKNACILEVGSEDGAFTDFLARRYPHATVEGLELREDWALACSAWAIDTRRAPRLTFRQGDILSLSDANKYDAIFCLDVLGYIPDDARALQNLVRALVPNGLLVIHQPNTTYRQYNGTLHHVSPEEAGRITGGHVRHGYSPEELRSLITNAHLIPEKILPLHGPCSDRAHRIHRRLEHPAPLRLLALPIIDTLWWLDSRRPPAQGNTHLAFARKPAPPLPAEAP